MIPQFSTGFVGILVALGRMDSGVAVYLPKPLIEKVDRVARSEVRSRTNATRWLLEQALRDRERRDKRRDEDAAVITGRPVAGPGRLNRWEMTKAHAAAAAEAEVTPATRVDVSKVASMVTSLASNVGLMGRRP